MRDYDISKTPQDGTLLKRTLLFELMIILYRLDLSDQTPEQVKMELYKKTFTYPSRRKGGIWEWVHPL